MSGTMVTRRELLRLSAAGALAAGVATLASCTTSPSSPRPKPTASGAGSALRLDRFGAVGDGRTDDTAAIQRAFDALRPGQTLSVPKGRVYRHTSTLHLATPDVRIEGPGRLLATTEQASALQLSADRITLADLTVSMGPTTQRWSAAEQHKIYIGTHDGITLQNVLVDGSAAAGVYAYGATGFRFHHVTVRDTRADGIHLTNGSRKGTVTRPRVARSGDDGVAVVSYLQDPVPCSDITITSPQVRTTTGGRGVSVVGGHDISYRDIDVERSSAAGVYLACEGGDFVTHPTTRVSVSGGRVVGANTDTAIDHGAVLVYSGRAGGSVSDVTVSNLTVSGTRTSCSRQVGVLADNPQELVNGVTFRNLRLAADPKPYEGDAPTSGFVLDHVTAAGVAVTASK